MHPVRVLFQVAGRCEVLKLQQVLLKCDATMLASGTCDEVHANHGAAATTLSPSNRPSLLLIASSARPIIILPSSFVIPSEVNPSRLLFVKGRLAAGNRLSLLRTTTPYKYHIYTLLLCDGYFKTTSSAVSLPCFALSYQML